MCIVRSQCVKVRQWIPLNFYVCLNELMYFQAHQRDSRRRDLRPAHRVRHLLRSERKLAAIASRAASATCSGESARFSLETTRYFSAFVGVFPEQMSFSSHTVLAFQFVWFEMLNVFMHLCTNMCNSYLGNLYTQLKVERV